MYQWSLALSILIQVFHLSIYIQWTLVASLLPPTTRLVCIKYDKSPDTIAYSCLYLIRWDLCGFPSKLPPLELSCNINLWPSNFPHLLLSSFFSSLSLQVAALVWYNEFRTSAGILFYIWCQEIKTCDHWALGCCFHLVLPSLQWVHLVLMV